MVTGQSRHPVPVTVPVTNTETPVFPVTVTGKNLHPIPVTRMNKRTDPVTLTGLLARLAMKYPYLWLGVPRSSDSFC